MIKPDAGLWVQLPLFAAERHEPKRAARPDVGGTVPAAKRRSRYRASHVRVTSDESVIQSSDQGTKLSAEITWQLARSLTDEQLAEVRAKLRRPAA